MTSDRVPASTYRVQVTADHDLHEVARRLPYVHDLGADWIYLSPVLQATPGSTHGYDVTDFSRVDASRGGGDGLRAVAQEAHRLGMGVLVDIVPNHMGVSEAEANAWWWDLLRHGPGSEHAGAFDVDWDYGGGRIRIPVLGDDDLPHEHAGIGHLEVVTTDDGGELRYHDHRFPLAPGSFSGSPDEDDADQVHARQHYELVSWRRGDAELNYRRFFTVSTLAAVRVELPEVFHAAHTEVRRWFDEGLVDGLRIDHPDGLRDPEGYLEFLLGLTGGAYTLVEKILEPGEQLPRGWAMDGTTGYDVLALLDRVLVDPAGREPLEELENRLRGHEVDWHELVHDRKRVVADQSLLAETRRVVRELPDLMPSPAWVLEDAVAEVLACFPVYRSYLPLGQEHLDDALAEARRRRPDLADALDELAPRLADAEGPTAKRFQQTSGMVMAKGVEDNAFYRWSRLTSLNEVGADPSVFSITPDDFHAAMSARQQEWPHAMTTLSTHDTKRSEDTRARITAIAEDPAAWAEGLDAIQAAAPIPDGGFANLLWQAAVGAWPVSRERLHAYAEKAMREAGEHTTWTDPSEEYESAVHRAIDTVPDELLAGLAEHYGPAGESNSLALKLLAITVPGVPDVYQGSEAEERSLVDPDNRRPVDHDALVASLADGSHPKQALTAHALRLRRDRPELFTTYEPVRAEGPAAEHVIAFDRGGAVTVATRLPMGLAARGGWGDTVVHLPWGTEKVADVLGDQPAALLVRP